MSEACIRCGGSAMVKVNRCWSCYSCAAMVQLYHPIVHRRRAA